MIPPQYRPPQPPGRVNWHRVIAIVLWVVSAWYAVQAIQVLNLLSGFWGPFIGTKGQLWLLYAIAVGVAAGLGGWHLWRKGNTTAPGPGSKPGPWIAPKPPAGPTEPKPYSTTPGWYPNPWGMGKRWWDGAHWTRETSP
jgi:hypothetical protein